MIVMLRTQTVTKSDGQGWMGRPAWRLAREVQWGDLWPSWYGNNRKKVQVLDPDSRKARLRNQAEREARERAERAEVDAAVRSYGFDVPADVMDRHGRG